MQTLDVCKKDDGKIWHRTPTTNDEGVLVTITNTVSSALSLHTRNVRFLHAAFDSTGDAFLAGDHQGNIYMFNLHKNRFNLVQRTGSPCSVLAFTLRRRSEFLVAMADYSLKCFDSDTKELVAWMKGHDSVIHNISLHASGRYALTSSQDAAQLWDLDTFQRKRKLNIKQNVGIVKVFFLPLSNTILTCFKDDSVFAWESDTLACKYQLHIPEGQSPHFKAFACTRDGRLLVGGGRSRFIHVWALDTHKLQQVIELPSKVTSVKQLEFLPDGFDGGANQVLGVLSQDGLMRFINIHSHKLLFEIGAHDDRVGSVAMSTGGRHITAVMESGNLKVYSVKKLSSEVNQPPPPLVKLSKSSKMNDVDQVKTSKKARHKEAGGRAKQNGLTSVLSETSSLPDGLNMERLKAILKGYGEYPTKYRMFIWRSILRLPENHATYAALVDKGTHPAFENMHEKYPIKSRKLLRVLQRVLSALAHWSPLFGETDYLPMLAFPFIKLFQNNQLVCFEIIATILLNWCQHWFEYFPNPPINMLGLVENVLAHHDKEVLTHLVQQGVTSQTYAWPVLETLFSEVLTRDEWLRMFDNVFSNPPSFLLMVVVAYCTMNRGPLLKCNEYNDFKYFFHHRNAVNVSQVIREAYRLMETTPDDIHPSKTLESFTPLTQGQYPVFNKYPTFIVDYQVQERERIRQEEVDYLRQRESSLELQKETQRRQTEEEGWYRQQELLRLAEEKRRQMITDEEKKLAHQRTRLTAMNRELKLKELQLLDATRRKFLQYQQQQKHTELARLDDEIRRKAELREVETRDAVDGAEIRNMELQLQKHMFEQELHRDFVETTQKQKVDLDARRRQQDLDHNTDRFTLQAERDRQLASMREAHESLAQADQLATDASMKAEIEYRHKLEELQRERQKQQVSRMADENYKLEESMHHLMKDVESMKLSKAETVGEQGQSDVAQIARLQQLENQADEAHSRLANLNQRQDQMLREVAEMKGRGNFTAAPPASDSYRGVHLNDTISSENSAQFSLDRGRDQIEAGERQLMADVRNLRHRLAQESRNKRPPPEYITS